MICRLLLTVLMAASTALAADSGFCALTLAIQTKEGKGIDSVAKLINRQGAVVDSVHTLDGSVRFCDFEFGPHSVHIEAQDFFPTTISGVRIRFFEPRTIRVVLNQISSGDGGTTGCRIDLRVKDTTLANVPFPFLVLRNGNASLKGDERGRLAAPVSLGRQLTFTIQAEGYEPLELTFDCKSIKRYEETVVLNRRQ